jgi:hypothetical protein
MATPAQRETPPMIVIQVTLTQEDGLRAATKEASIRRSICWRRIKDKPSQVHRARISNLVAFTFLNEK